MPLRAACHQPRLNSRPHGSDQPAIAGAKEPGSPWRKTSPGDVIPLDCPQSRGLNTFEAQRQSVLPTPLLLTGLLLLRELPQLQRYPRLLQAVDTADDPPWSDLVRVVTAVRRGALDAALETLASLRTNSELQPAAIANAFAAIAFCRTDQLQESRTAMETLGTLMRDHDWEGCWVSYARCLIAKTEAENAIQVDTTPQPSAGQSLPAQIRSTPIKSKAQLQGSPAHTYGQVYT